jgi:uncharacterized protein (DUF924 family)
MRRLQWRHVSIVLRPVSPEAADAILAGRAPPDVRVEEDHPTEFSAGVAKQAGKGSPLGPFFIHRADDDVVVGEIGGGVTSPGVAEIGYAIVRSCWARGYATTAVRELVALARANAAIERVVAHAPLDRPASGRVLAKAGFTLAGETDDEHEGVKMRVQRWELALDEPPPEAQAFLEFWFGPPGGPIGAAARWWEKDAAFDALLRERWSDLHAAILAGRREDWRARARSCLAYVVVLDQIARNVHRGTPLAFAGDAFAQTATLRGIRDGFDRGFDGVERRFFYMPLLHAEDRELQEQAILQFATLAAALPEAERGPVLTQVIMGARHRNVILRFGRFPHRNAILGRASSPEEIAFLKEPSSSF